MKTKQMVKKVKAFDILTLWSVSGSPTQSHVPSRDCCTRVELKSHENFTTGMLVVKMLYWFPLKALKFKQLHDKD